MDIKKILNLLLNDTAILTPELLKPYWRKVNKESGIHTTGHCYAASEALFYMLGGRDKSPYRPKILKIETGTHWFLEHKDTGEILDPTYTQFPNGVDYSKGKGKMFMQQSDRSKEIIKRLEKEYETY